MPDIDLDAIEARANAATDGPWGYPFAGKNRITTPVDIDVTHADWGGENLREYVLSCLDDRNAWRAADAEFIAHARTDVPALVALVRAKQSWIDGAKVDMAAMEEERAKALAAIALAGEEIERASVEVKRADRQRDDARAAIAAVREACVGVEDCDYATIVVAKVLTALDVRHDPSATTEGGA